MQARDIMTTTIVSVDPETTVSEVARTLLAHNIGAVPVVNENGGVMGIVSEADFLRRSETGTLRPRSWLSFFEDSPTLAAQYARVHGTKARDLMNSDIVSVTPESGLLDVVDLMERRNVRRVLVMDGDRMRGIVCRSDLLRGMLASRDQATAGESDRAIRAMLLGELREQPWSSVSGNNIIVANGVVSFWGESGSDEEGKALRVAAENIPGVKRVWDRTTRRREVLAPII